MKNSVPQKGDIYWVRLDPTSGKEINKTRPCLIVSSNTVNHSGLVVIAPITSNIERVYERIEVKISVNGKPGKVILRQIRAIDRLRIVGERLSSITLSELNQVEAALRTILGL